MVVGVCENAAKNHELSQKYGEMRGGDVVINLITHDEFIYNAHKIKFI